MRLTPAGLHAELEVQAGDRPMPAIVGWHPWFRRVLRDAAGAAVGGPVIVDLDAGGMLRRGADGLPDGTVVRPIPPEPWDDCFVDVAGAPGVHWPGALEVRIDSDARFWVVYTEREEGVCVEPQTGPPNGLNTGEHAVVEPGVAAGGLDDDALAPPRLTARRAARRARAVAARRAEPPRRPAPLPYPAAAGKIRSKFATSCAPSASGSSPRCSATQAAVIRTQAGSLRRRGAPGAERYGASVSTRSRSAGTSRTLSAVASSPFRKQRPEIETAQPSSSAAAT